jgi:hypothetical protein
METAREQVKADKRREAEEIADRRELIAVVSRSLGALESA